MKEIALEQQKKELQKIKDEQVQSDLILELLEKQLLEKNNLSKDKQSELTKIVMQLAIKNIEARKIIKTMECIINNYKI